MNQATQVPNDYGLKPCPFCGSSHVRIMYGMSSQIRGIFCHGCNAMVDWPIDREPTGTETYGELEDRWKAKWNKRAAEDGHPTAAEQ